MRGDRLEGRYACQIRLGLAVSRLSRSGQAWGVLRLKPLEFRAYMRSAHRIERSR